VAAAAAAMVDAGFERRRTCKLALAFVGKCPRSLILSCGSAGRASAASSAARAGTNYHWKAEQLPPSAPWSEATLMAFKAFMYFSGKGKPKARCMLYHIFPAV